MRVVVGPRGPHPSSLDCQALTIEAPERPATFVPALRLHLKGTAVPQRPRFLPVWRAFTLSLAIFGAAIGACSSLARAETMQSALARAYQNNPQLNAQRTKLRETDEKVPQALSGYRPTVGADAGVGRQYTDTTVVVPAITSPPTPSPSGLARVTGTTTPASVGVTATQTLYDGFSTANGVRAAETQVNAERQVLRMTEQTVLLAAATAYMDVLRDEADLIIQRSNVQVLTQTLKEVRARYGIGDVTATDLAQGEAQLASGQSTVIDSEATLMTTRAEFQRIVGVEPAHLAPASSVDLLVPETLTAATDLALTENPQVIAAMYGVDVAELKTRLAEAALFPKAVLEGNVSDQDYSNILTPKLLTSSIMLHVKVPLYQGGKEFADIRQQKEAIAEQRLQLDQVRDEVRRDVVRGWWRLRAARARIEANKREAQAAETAFNGVQAEARAGRRTTLDVLISQQNLVSARLKTVTGQHDLVVASYTMLAALGLLSPQSLKLPTQIYDPQVHYQQVRDSWGGLRTP